MLRQAPHRPDARGRRDHGCHGTHARDQATVTTRRPRRRRNTEALLLVAGYGVCLLAFAQVTLVLDSTC